MQTTLVKKVSATQSVWHWCLKTELAHSQTSEESYSSSHNENRGEKKTEIKNSYLSLRWGQLREWREREMCHTRVERWMERDEEEEDDDEEKEEGEQRRQCRWQAGRWLLMSTERERDWHTELFKKKKKKTGDKCHHYIQRMRCHEAAFFSRSEREIGGTCW